MNKTNIEWATRSWNPWTGCAAVSEGCAHCYAREMAETRLRGRCGYPQDEPFSLRFHPDRVEEPLHMRRGQRVFVCSMGDIGHPDIAWEDFLEVMRVIKRCSRHQFMFLTKRPEVLLERMQILAGTHPNIDTLASTAYLANLPNLWVGVSVENQRRADARIPVLLEIQAAGRFVSVEPMLGPVTLVNAAIRQTNPGMCAPPIFEKYNFLTGERFLVQDESSTWIGSKKTAALDWVICGAETGANKRTCKTEWIDSLRRQCAVAGIPFFGKKDSAGKSILPREFPKALRLEGALRHE